MITYKDTKYQIVNRTTVDSMVNTPRVQEMLKGIGVTATLTVKKPAGRVYWSLDEFETGNFGNLSRLGG